jgi:hypothetical protein
LIPEATSARIKRVSDFIASHKATAAEATAYAATLLGAKDDDVLRYRKFVTV